MCFIRILKNCNNNNKKVNLYLWYHWVLKSCFKMVANLAYLLPRKCKKKEGWPCVHSQGAPRSVSAASIFPGPGNPGDPGTSQLLGQAWRTSSWKSNIKISNLVKRRQKIIWGNENLIFWLNPLICIPWDIQGEIIH